ncbi:DedA family protein [Terribacillus saccharophilus]|uniref:DedA family protein n=1 Tax=Terribacillus saccharophilus TaxID=361277 RepID=UPI003981F4B8
MESWITDLMGTYGYPAILFLMLLENIFPPIPSEIILVFGGFLAATTSLTPIGVILAATAGAMLGSTILYWIGKIFDLERLENWVNRWGRFLKLKASHLHKADAWFDKYGVWTVFLCRFIPVVRSLISVPAGMAKMHFGQFLLYSTFGTLIWNAVVVLLGVWLGASWDTVETYLGYYQYGVLLLAFFVLAGAGFWFQQRFRKKKTMQTVRNKSNV